MSKHKAVLSNGHIVTTRPGNDWTLIYVDHDDSSQKQRMLLFGAENHSSALDDATDSFALLDEENHIEFHALYMNREAAHIATSLEQHSHTTRACCSIWYIAVATGIRTRMTVKAPSLATALEIVRFPEVPPGESPDDYIEITGVGLWSITASDIIE